MATIDKDALLTDIKTILPDSNPLPDSTMLSIITRIVIVVGDDDINYGEVACKSMRAIADVNAAKADVDTGRLKKEKVGDHEEEFFSSTTGGATWKEFRDSLRELCPVIYGYSFLSKGGMYINTTPLPNPLEPQSY